MSGWKKLAAASAAGGGGLDVDEVFSTYLWTGNGSSQTITNGIDLDGEGGLVWTAGRNSAEGPYTWDTERGVNIALATPFTSGNSTQSSSLTSFNSNGFSVGSSFSTNRNEKTYVSWTFRKAPKLCDVVTYIGDASDQVVSHSLGSTPGCIIIKATSATGDWIVYHRGLTNNGANHSVKLNSTAAQVNQGGLVATDTTFTLYHTATVNTNGVSYVAYVFAHNDGDGEFGPDGDQDIIKCGSYTGDGTEDGSNEIDLGFEPQWVMIKRASGTDNWVVIDNMRGWVTGRFNNENKTQVIYPNSTNTEINDTLSNITSTGFMLRNNSSKVNASGNNYIYMAIRRGSLFPPESATEVFDIEYYGQTSTSAPAWHSEFPLDFAFYRNKSTDQDFNVYSRLMQTGGLWFRNPAQFTDAQATFDFMDGYYNAAGSSSNLYSWMWKRAPSYFDVCCFTGTGSARTVSHNLGVAPEMMWVKSRNSAYNWTVFHSALGNNKGAYLNTTAAPFTNTATWNNTAPTASVFSVNNDGYTNQNGDVFIAYLFATLPGVSKVGSYTGNGSSQTIDCGFTSGARFILVRRTDSSGDWYIWDTARGIGSGNDPHLALNRSDQAEVTSDDSVDPASSGFIVNQVSATNINVSSATYIFYAIA
jgi:hypothetical protein